MNNKIHLILFLLMMAPALTDRAGAEEAVAAQELPDFDNPETLRKILAEAILRDALEERGPEGAKLFYAPDTQNPYTGWIKKLHGNGKVALLGALKDGEPAGLWTWWDENALKEDEKRY